MTALFVVAVVLLAVQGVVIGVLASRVRSLEHDQEMTLRWVRRNMKQVSGSG